MAPLEEGHAVLTKEVMRELLTSIMPGRSQEEFAARNDADFAYEIEGLGRFRCNVFMDRKGMGGVFRLIPSKIMTAEELGLSKAIMDLCDLSKGLVVVTSCSHRGIVGICRNAVRFTGVPKVHAVIGGFHLSGLDDARITKVVDAFRELDVDHVVPQHCTGIEAIAAVMHRLPGHFTASSVGTTFEFSAPS